MRNKKTTLLLVSVVLLAAVSVSAYFFTTKQPERQSPLVQVLVGSYNFAEAYDVFPETITPRPFANDGGVVSRAYLSEKNSTASIVRWSDQVGNVLFFESPTENRIVHGASSVKDSVSFSPNGLYLAFSELNVPFGSTLYSENVADWNIVVVSTENDTRVVVESGYQPFIISENPLVIIYSTPEGVVAYHDTSKEKVVLLPERTIEHTSRAGLASPKGEYLGFFNPTTSRYSIFRAEGDFPYTLNPIGEVPVSTEISTLSEDAFLGIVRDQETNERTLWRFAFKDFIDPSLPRTLLHTFTEDTPVYSIIP